MRFVFLFALFSILLVTSSICSETQACLNKCKDHKKEEYSRAICKIKCLLPEDEEEDEEKPKPKLAIEINKPAAPVQHKSPKAVKLPRKVYKTEAEMWKSIEAQTSGLKKSKKMQKLVSKKTGQKITSVSAADQQFLTKLFSTVKKNVNKFWNNKQSIIDAGKQQAQQWIKKITGKDVQLSDSDISFFHSKFPLTAKPNADAEILPVFATIQEKGMKIINDYRSKINNVMLNKFGVNYQLSDAELSSMCEGICNLEKKNVFRMYCRAACKSLQK